MLPPDPPRSGGRRPQRRLRAYIRNDSSSGLPGALGRLAQHDLVEGRHDVGIGAATADVAAHQLANLVGGPRLALGDQAGGGADLARGAVAALKGVVIDEGLLQRMKRVPLCQAFDRRYARTILHDRKRKARITAPTIDQNGAATALAVITALLGAGKVEIEAKRVEQRGPRRDRQFAFDAVDMKRDRRLGGGGKLLQALASR